MIWWVILTSLIPFAWSIDAIEVVLTKDVDLCEEMCSNTHPLHTYDKPEHLKCCHRGCRFFSIVNVLGLDKDLDKVLNLCYASCGEAYNNTNENRSCTIGCEGQKANAMKKDTLKTPLTDPLHPLMSVQAVYTSVVGRMSQFMSSSWTVYIQEDTGNMVLSKDTPDIIGLQEMIPEEGEPSDGFNLLTSKENSRISSFVETSTEQKQSLDWLSCISRQSGVPRRILLLVLLLAIVVMIWLCCATAATSQEQKVRRVHVYSDLTYLSACDPSEQVKIQPSLDEQAPPLPDKTPLIIQ